MRVTGFKQQDAVAASIDEPGRSHAARCATANYDIVKFIVTQFLISVICCSETSCLWQTRFHQWARTDVSALSRSVSRFKLFQ